MVFYGKVGEKNIEPVQKIVRHFFEVVEEGALGHRELVLLAISCEATGNRIHDIKTQMIVGSCKHNMSGVKVQEGKKSIVLKPVGRLIRPNNVGIKAVPLTINYNDYAGLAEDRSSLLFVLEDGKRIEIYIRVRLRDVYTLRLNAITDRVASTLAIWDEVIQDKLDTKWLWTRKLLSLMTLECLLKSLKLWDTVDTKDVFRNEAVIKLMLDDTLMGNLERIQELQGLDEYNIYSRDAKQRAEDGSLLLTCGEWLSSGGLDVVSDVQADPIDESDLAEWKGILESDLGLELPPLAKHGDMRKESVVGLELAPDEDSIMALFM